LIRAVLCFRSSAGPLGIKGSNRDDLILRLDDCELDAVDPEKGGLEELAIIRVEDKGQHNRIPLFDQSAR
jgi:hypothetical protein